MRVFIGIPFLAQVEVKTRRLSGGGTVLVNARDCTLRDHDEKSGLNFRVRESCLSGLTTTRSVG